jgi:hypothetical protein
LLLFHFGLQPFSEQGSNPEIIGYANDKQAYHARYRIRIVLFALELLVPVIEISPTSWGFAGKGRSTLPEVLRIVTERNLVASDEYVKQCSLHPMIGA